MQTHSKMTGRNRRLYNEWKILEERFSDEKSVAISVEKCNAEGMPVAYRIHYALRSICGVERAEQLNEKGVSNPPIFASDFEMRVSIPAGYPSIDAPAEYRFVNETVEGEKVALPWHPNIRYFGEMKGRVCLNATDSFVELAWGVERVKQYLTYERYHAIAEPPFPEDLKVARWVVEQGEPQGWVAFAQN